MRRSALYLALRFALCLMAFSTVAYLYIDQQNDLIELRRQIPEVEKEVKRLGEENLALRFAIERFCNPRHLLELLREPEFRHLRFPSSDEVVVIEMKGEEADGGSPF